MLWAGREKGCPRVDAPSGLRYLGTYLALRQRKLSPACLSPRARVQVPYAHLVPDAPKQQGEVNRHDKSADCDSTPRDNNHLMLLPITHPFDSRYGHLRCG